MSPRPPQSRQIRQHSLTPTLHLIRLLSELCCLRESLASRLASTAFLELAVGECSRGSLGEDARADLLLLLTRIASDPDQATRRHLLQSLARTLHEPFFGAFSKAKGRHLALNALSLLSLLMPEAKEGDAAGETLTWLQHFAVAVVRPLLLVEDRAVATSGGNFVLSLLQIDASVAEGKGRVGRGGSCVWLLGWSPVSGRRLRADVFAYVLGRLRPLPQISSSTGESDGPT